ncbi:MAG TPA: hypothetical protein VK935_16145, partial [Actinomycetospora sp.]|nr:hypothetical protein [Actinomycetospora sp.]
MARPASEVPDPPPGPAAREIAGPADARGWLEQAIAVRVRELRRLGGSTVADVAARAGISKAT